MDNIDLEGLEDLYLDDYCDEYEDYKDNEKYYWKK